MANPRFWLLASGCRSRAGHGLRSLLKGGGRQNLTHLMPFPGAHILTYYLRRYRERQRYRVTERGLVGQWHLLWSTSDSAARLDPQPQRMKKIVAPPDRYWADPFGWKQDGAFYIFCEEVLYSKRRGHISAIPVDGDGHVLGPSIKIIEEPYHLSYPFLFKYEGGLYLLPESGFANVLNLYRCVEFPGRWERVRTVFEGVQYYDPTLLEHDGRWWLFATMRNPRRLRLPDHDLVLFSAESPLAERWTPHPCNPIVRNFKRARPAGRLFQHEGRLYRPSQNCQDRYGDSLNINEIVEFDARRYNERLVKEVRPEATPGYVGLHHIDWHAGVMIMDTHRLIPENEIAR